MDLENMIRQEEDKRSIKENIKDLAWALDRMKKNIEDDEMPDITRAGIIREIECIEIIVEAIQNKVR